MKKLLVIAAVGFLAASANAHGADPLMKSFINDLNHHKFFNPAVETAKNDVLANQDLKNFNYQTGAAFYVDFGYIPIDAWEYSGEFDKISFEKNGVTYTAYYDLDSKLVGTISKAAQSDLPFSALEKINRRYDGYTIENVIFFDDNELNETDMIYYNRRFEDEDKYFVEFKNAQSDIIVQVNMDGDVTYFTTI